MKTCDVHTNVESVYTDSRGTRYCGICKSQANEDLIKELPYNVCVNHPETQAIYVLDGYYLCGSCFVK